jgi:hypothetical protein
MTRLVSIAASFVVVAALAGCSDGDDVDLRTREDEPVAETSVEPEEDKGYRDGLRTGRRDALERIDEVRESAFARGVDYVLHGLEVEPGQDYAIAFKQGRRGFFVKDSLPMRPGLAYECLPQTPYCNAMPTGTEVPSATSEPAPQDACHPDYPNVCLDPTAPDYDCAGSGQDGPEFVEGPVRVIGSDPYDLDGSPRDGFGCRT